MTYDLRTSFFIGALHASRFVANILQELFSKLELYGVLNLRESNEVLMYTHQIGSQLGSQPQVQHLLREFRAQRHAC